MLSSGTLSQNLDFKNFDRIYRSLKCHQRSSTTLDAHGVINWIVVGENTRERSNAAVVDHRDHQALSAARFRRAGPLATAGSCCWLCCAAPHFQNTFDSNDVYIYGPNCRNSINVGTGKLRQRPARTSQTRSTFCSPKHVLSSAPVSRASWHSVTKRFARRHVT